MRKFLLWLFDLQETDRLSRELRDCQSRERYWKEAAGHAKQALEDSMRERNRIAAGNAAGANNHFGWVLDLLSEIQALPEDQR